MAIISFNQRKRLEINLDKATFIIIKFCKIFGKKKDFISTLLDWALLLRDSLSVPKTNTISFPLQSLLISNSNSFIFSIQFKEKSFFPAENKGWTNLHRLGSVESVWWNYLGPVLIRFARDYFARFNYCVTQTSIGQHTMMIISLFWSII